MFYSNVVVITCSCPFQTSYDAIVEEAELLGASRLYTPISLHKKEASNKSLQDLTPAGHL